MIVTAEQWARTRRKNHGLFIVLEGVNGAGKSSAMRVLSAGLTASGLKTRCTFEPGDTELGRKLRPLVLEPQGDKPSQLAELFIFAADRAEHVTKLIKPELAQGNCVLCDRYYYSTTAFQGYGRGIDLKLINQINETAIAGLFPDIVILLDVDAETGLARTKKRADDPRNADAFETEKIDFHKRIRQGFMKMASELPEPFLVVDASRSEAEVHTDLANFAALLKDGQ